MEKHLQDSLDLLSKLLDETDPDELLADFLKFQDESKGGVTVDEFFHDLGLTSIPDWQSMCSAPKTGQVLVYDKQNEQFYTAHWCNNESVWSVGCFEFISDESRLVWQRLPDKPNNI